MSNKYSDNPSLLFTDIADAIREKTGETELIDAVDFPEKIKSVETTIDYVNENITSISDYAYYGMNNLKSVYLPYIETIGVKAFSGCSNLESVVICSKDIDISSDSFPSNEGLSMYGVNGGTLETFATTNNILFAPLSSWDSSATAEDSVTVTYVSKFNTLCIYGNGSMETYLGVSRVPWYDLRAEIHHASIKEGVSYISNFCFIDCVNLTSVTLPDGVISIGQSAFSRCTSLTSIILPESLTKIASSVFNDSTYLTDIYYKGTMAQWGAITFQDGWDKNTPNYTVHCTDGDITKS